MRLPARGKMQAEDVKNMDEKMAVRIYKREVWLCGRMPSLEERQKIGILANPPQAAPPEVVKACAMYSEIYARRMLDGKDVRPAIWRSKSWWWLRRQLLRFLLAQRGW